MSLTKYLGALLANFIRKPITTKTAYINTSWVNDCKEKLYFVFYKIKKNRKLQQNCSTVTKYTK